MQLLTAVNCQLSQQTQSRSRLFSYVLRWSGGTWLEKYFNIYYIIKKKFENHCAKWENFRDWFQLCGLCHHGCITISYSTHRMEYDS